MPELCILTSYYVITYKHQNSLFKRNKKAMVKKIILSLLLILSSHLSIYSQMLFSENLTMDIDSTKTIQGSLLPVLDFKTEKENILTFKNTANLNILIKHQRVINLINKLEISTYGKKSNGKWRICTHRISLFSKPCL